MIARTLLVLLALSASSLASPTTQPKWIWHQAPSPPGGKHSKLLEACFRRTIELPRGAAIGGGLLVLTADSATCRVFLNGKPLGQKQTDWRSIWGVQLGRHLQPGKNTLAIIAGKPSGAAGLVGKIEIELVGAASAAVPGKLEIVTDGQWKVSTAATDDWTTADDTAWPAAREVAPLGGPPWGELALVPSRQPVPWPTVPTTRPLTPAQGQDLLEADWLMQVGNQPSLDDVLAETDSAARIARRFAGHATRPSFAGELAELDRLSAAAAKAGQVLRRWEADDELRRLYLAVRQVKRRIVLRNPAIDFQRILLIDGSPPAGHESGHRNTYGGDLRRIGATRILVLDGLRPDAPARDVVPTGGGGVMRMDLSFDATRLLFSMVPAREHSFRLYEVTLQPDGTASGPPRQLTNSPYHDLDPIYLPDGRIVFSTTRGNTYVRCLPNSPCSVLARCDADGGNIRIISNNNEPDYTPCLLPDGRILYTRWEYTERPLWRLQALWTMNPDGTSVAHYWGNRSSHPDMLWEARPIPGTNRVMFTGVGHHDVGGGPIGVVDVSEGRDHPEGLYKVTAECAWTEVGDPPRATQRIYSPRYRPCIQHTRFASPYPLSPDDFLVCARGGRTPYCLYLMDIDGNRELIYVGTGPGGVWCAMPLRPRVPPPVIPDRVQWPQAGQKPTDGVFYSANVTEGVEGLAQAPGKARFIRVLQQDHKTYSMGFKSYRHSGPVISALQEDSVKRILGTAPIGPDGSVSFRVPAGRAVYFQLLDENQRCLQIMRSFTGVMPGEARGCVGCHEAHSRAVTPTASIARAGSYQPVELTPPPWGAEVSISYERFAQPVLDKHCGKCHQGDGKGRKVLDLTLRGGLHEKGITDPKLLPFKEPYLTLIGDTSWAGARLDPKTKGYGLAGALPVEAGNRGDAYGPIPPMSSLSYTSPLIQLATSGKHHDVKIQGEDLLRLIAWVDANCVYRGEEEVRQIPDPDEATFRNHNWQVPPRTRTAPVIDRLQPVTDPRPPLNGATPQ